MPTDLTDLERMFIMDAIENWLAEPHAPNTDAIVQGLRAKIEGDAGDPIRVLFENIRALRARGISLGDALGLSPPKHA